MPLEVTTTPIWIEAPGKPSGTSKDTPDFESGCTLLPKEILVDISETCGYIFEYMFIYKNTMKKKKPKPLSEERCGVRVLHRDRIQKALREASPEKETARLASIYQSSG